MNWEDCYQLYRDMLNENNLTLDQYFQSYRLEQGPIAGANSVLEQARPLLNDPADAAIDWVWDAATDPEKRLFLRDVLRIESIVHQRYGPSLIRAAVYTFDPSWPKWFIRPLIPSYGRESIGRTLFDYIRSGTKLEKIGALYSLYFIGVVPSSSGSQVILTDSYQDGLRFNLGDMDYQIYKLARSPWTLREFVENDDQVVRRNLIGKFSIDPARYQRSERPLLQNAVELAANSSDKYVQKRLREQLDRLDR